MTHNPNINRYLVWTIYSHPSKALTLEAISSYEARQKLATAAGLDVTDCMARRAPRYFVSVRTLSSGWTAAWDEDYQTRDDAQKALDQMMAFHTNDTFLTRDDFRIDEV